MNTVSYANLMSVHEPYRGSVRIAEKIVRDTSTFALAPRFATNLEQDWRPSVNFTRIEIPDEGEAWCNVPRNAADPVSLIARWIDRQPINIDGIFVAALPECWILTAYRNTENNAIS